MDYKVVERNGSFTIENTSPYSYYSITPERYNSLEELLNIAVPIGFIGQQKVRAVCRFLHSKAGNVVSLASALQPHYGYGQEIEVGHTVDDMFTVVEVEKEHMKLRADRDIEMYVQSDMFVEDMGIPSPTCERLFIIPKDEISGWMHVDNLLNISADFTLDGKYLGSWVHASAETRNTDLRNAYVKGVKVTTSTICGSYLIQQEQDQRSSVVDCYITQSMLCVDKGFALRRSELNRVKCVPVTGNTLTVKRSELCRVALGFCDVVHIEDSKVAASTIERVEPHAAVFSKVFILESKVSNSCMSGDVKLERVQATFLQCSDSVVVAMTVPPQCSVRNSTLIRCQMSPRTTVENQFISRAKV